MSENPSRKLVEQRGRNRIIEYLESVTAFEQNPPPWGLNELINQWEDCTGIDHPIQEKLFTPPVYARREYKALLRVDAAWERFCDATPQNITDQPSTLELLQWADLVVTALQALAVFKERGRMLEDRVGAFPIF